MMFPSLLKPGFAVVLWVFLVAWDIFSLWLLRTPPPVCPKLKIASVRPWTLRRWCSLLAVGLIQALLEAVSWLASGLAPVSDLAMSH